MAYKHQIASLCYWNEFYKDSSLKVRSFVYRRKAAYLRLEDCRFVSCLASRCVNVFLSKTQNPILFQGACLWEGAQTCMGRTCSLLTGGFQLGFEPEPSPCEVSVLATAPLWSPLKVPLSWFSHLIGRCTEKQLVKVGFALGADLKTHCMNVWRTATAAAAGLGFSCFTPPPPPWVLCKQRVLLFV